MGSLRGVAPGLARPPVAPPPAAMAVLLLLLLLLLMIVLEGFACLDMELLLLRDDSFLGNI